MTKKRLLIVGMEDQNTNDSLKLMMDFEGYEVMSIQSANEALEYILNNSGAFDAIIIEPYIRKEDIDGFAMIEQIRESGNTSPIIALSNRAGVGDKVRGLNAGADAYLTKPFHKDELQAYIDATIRGRKLDNAEHETKATSITSRVDALKPGML